MKNNPLKTGDISSNSKGIGTVTPGMVEKRAADLARINNRSPETSIDTDAEQAQAELTGEDEADPKESLLESAPESDRWNIPAGSVGHKIVATSNEDEDEEGRSDNERLVEEGIAGAELDQMLQAEKQDRKNNK